MTIELSPGVRRLLDEPNVAHLATIQPDGSPHSIPVWTGLVCGLPAFPAGSESRKARNIAHDPRVSISVTDRKQPFVMAHIRGRVAQRIEGDVAWAMVDCISHQYTGAPYPRDADRVVFLIIPEHVWSTA